MSVTPGEARKSRLSLSALTDRIAANTSVSGWLMALPLTLVLLFFLVIPIIMIAVVSFWRATEFSIIPDFVFENYEFLLTSPVTLTVFINTFKYAIVTWVCTALI